MNGRVAKKLRKELRASELRIAGKSLDEFKAYVNSLPTRARLVLAYKIIRKLLCLALLVSASTAYAAVPDAQAIHAILGEARGEGYSGMYAVACAIRNRGHLRGVYGSKADISDASARTRQLAAKAWADSEEGPDVTHGAGNWENVDAFGTPYWAKGKTPTAVIGRHKFFKVK